MRRFDAATALAALLAVAGPLLVLYGALTAAGRDAAVEQLPFVLSAGAPGVAVTATGATVLSILRRRRQVGARLDALAAAANALVGGPRVD